MGAPVGINSVTQRVTFPGGGVVGVAGGGVTGAVGASVFNVAGSGVGVLPSPLAMVVMAVVVTTGVV